MDVSSSRFTRVLLVALAAGSLLSGCSKDEPTKPKASSSDTNSDDPNANARVTYQVRFGDPAKGSTVWGLSRNPSGDYHFRGRSNNLTGVGTFDAAGGLTHFLGTSYLPRGLSIVPASGPNPTRFLAVGAQSTDSDAESELGFATVFSSACSPLAQLPFAADTSDLWLNEMAAVTDSTYLVAGGERRGTTSYPFLALVKLTALGLMERLGSVTFVSEPTHWFYGGLAVIPSGSSPTELLIGAATTSSTGTYRIQGLRVGLPTLQPASIEWSHDIVARPGSATYINRLVGQGNDLYVVGTTDDDRKPTSSSGALWSSGVAASYTSGGDLRWMTVVSITKHDETFYNLAVTAGAMFAVGEAASYVQSGTDEFGYGLITRFDRNTGAVIENLTLGDDDSRGAIQVVNVVGSTLVCGGWCEQATNDGGYRGLFCTLSASASTAPGKVAATGRAPTRASAMPIPRRWGHDPGGR